MCHDGEITCEVSCRIAKAVRVFGCLRVLIFLNGSLSISTKRDVYEAAVLSVLLYGVEMWTVKAPDVRCLTTFHDRCVRKILGVSHFQQWREHISYLWTVDY